AIGLSALLVSTSRQMPICVAELQRAHMQVPVMLGGAAINRNFGRRAALVDGSTFYAPGVFYCKDAFEGLDTVNALVDPNERPRMVERIEREAREFAAQAQAFEQRAASATAQQQDFKVKVTRDVPVPAPTFWGPRVTGPKDVPFAKMFEGMDLKTLYRLHWGARGSGPEVDRLIRDEFEPRRLRLQREAEERG